jgi:peptide-methionine (S)-S-oxide reductase
LSKYIYLAVSILVLTSLWVITESKENLNTKKNYKDSIMTDTTKLKKVTFGEGCFWCVEAVYQSLKGVYQVESGYSGGTVKNPTYEQVCTGTTGHAEVAQITYDPNIITYEQLLEVFWHTHDPTTLNRQGADNGTQYRSVIFYNSDEEKKQAEDSKKKTDASGLWSDPIVTEISPLTEFYKAEDYHQDYYNNNKNSNSYCSIVIAPKLAKFYKEFGYLLKEEKN